MKFRKKPVVIEAFRFGFDSRPDWFCDKVSTNDVITDESGCVIRTLEGQMVGLIGDWVIKGIKGELYPCKHDIFLATYELAEPVIK